MPESWWRQRRRASVPTGTHSKQKKQPLCRQSARYCLQQSGVAQRSCACCCRPDSRVSLPGQPGRFYRSRCSQSDVVIRRHHPEQKRRRRERFHEIRRAFPSPPGRAEAARRYQTHLSPGRDPVERHIGWNVVAGHQVPHAILHALNFVPVVGTSIFQPARVVAVEPLLLLRR